MRPQRGNGFTWYWTPDVWAWDPGDGPWDPKYGPPVAPAYLDVSTDRLPPRDAYDFWRTHTFYNFDPDLPDERQKKVFRARAQAFYAPRAQLFVYDSDPISGHRTRSQAKADGGALLDVGLVLAGRRRFTPDPDATVPARYLFQAGDFFVYDSSRPCRSAWETHRGLHMSLDRSLLRSAFNGSMPSNAALLNILGRSRLSPFFRTHMRLLAEQLPSLSFAERIVAVESAVDLILAMLRTGSDPYDPRRGPTEAEDAHFSWQGMFVAAQRYIDAHLGDPALQAVDIAAAIGCSRATLYRIFARQQLTVASYVRERRLLRSWHLLQESPRHVTVTTIALRCGFGDVSHFSKTFKRRFGVTPVDARTVRDLSPDPTAAQGTR